MLCCSTGLPFSVLAMTRNDSAMMHEEMRRNVVRVFIIALIFLRTEFS